jgi:hypothetical protein
MAERTLLKIVVQNQDERLAEWVGRTVRFILNQQFDTHAVLNSMGEGHYDIVVSANAVRYMNLTESAMPFLQYVLVCVVRAQGWQVEVANKRPRSKVPLKIWGGVHYLVRHLESDLFGGAKVTFCSADMEPEHSIWVGGPFVANAVSKRGFAFGMVVGFDLINGKAYARMRDYQFGYRRFLVDDPEWPSRHLGKCLFIQLLRYRGHTSCWRLGDWCQPEHELDESWPLSISSSSDKCLEPSLGSMPVLASINCDQLELFDQ